MSDRAYFGVVFFCVGAAVLILPFWGEDFARGMTKIVDDRTGFGQIISALLLVFSAVALVMLGLWILLPRRK